MKKTLLTTATICLLTACSSAQKTGKEKSEVPAAVENAFKKDFPGVDDAEWEKEGENFEAEFEINDVETSATYNAGGKLQETESEIDITALPQKARDFITTEGKGQKIKEAAKIVFPDGTVKYEAEVKRKDLIFDSAGNLVETSFKK